MEIGFNSPVESSICSGENRAAQWCGQADEGFDVMRISLRAPVLAIGLVAVFAGTALATASGGFHPAIVGRATLGDPVQYNTGPIKFQTKEGVDIVTISVAIDPNGSSGWLTRPGVVLASVA